MRVGCMPLTPEDVSNKRFTAVRLREGYDMTEVDQFLDEVEAELARLYRENDAPRAKLGLAPNEAASAPEPAEPAGTAEPADSGESRDDGDRSEETART